jgi:hypothetical protein
VIFDLLLQSCFPDTGLKYPVKLIIFYDKRMSKKTLQIQYFDFAGNKNIL